MSKINKARDKMKRLEHEIEMIEKFSTPLDDVGIEVNWVEGASGPNGFLSCKVDTLKELHKILEIYPTTESDIVLRFASRDNQQTYSPFTIEVNNWSSEYTASKASVKWYSDEIEVWCDVPISEFGEYAVKREQTKTVRRGNKTVSKTDGFHVLIQTSGVSVMTYASGDSWGNSYTTYAKDSSQRNTMNKILGVNDDL